MNFLAVPDLRRGLEFGVQLTQRPDESRGKVLGPRHDTQHRTPLFFTLDRLDPAERLRQSDPYPLDPFQKDAAACATPDSAASAWSCKCGIPTASCNPLIWL